MRNTINVFAPVIIGNRIEYKYEVMGEWKEAFNLEESFFIEYSRDISGISQSTAIVPFICNILPIAWVYDAEIHAERCDKAFYESISGSTVESADGDRRRIIYRIPDIRTKQRQYRRVCAGCTYSS